jgi:hypothetical protein
MPAPYPANNPVYIGSLFPNAVDEINAEREIADAIMAVQASLLGSGGAPPISNPGPVSPGNGTTTGAKLFSGSGAPATGMGAVGDYYFRSDTPATANQRIYVKTAAAVWTGIV